MPKYHIYIRQDVDGLLQKEAKRYGVTAKDLLRMRVEMLSATLSLGELRGDIQRCQAATASVFELLERLASEMGFMAGVVRSSAPEKTPAAREGELLESHFRRLAAGLRRSVAAPPATREREGAGGV